MYSELTKTSTALPRLVLIFVNPLYKQDAGYKYPTYGFQVAVGRILESAIQFSGSLLGTGSPAYQLNSSSSYVSENSQKDWSLLIDNRAGKGTTGLMPS